MIDPAARGAWSALESRLRPFIARRVRAAVDVDDVLQEVFLRMQRGLAGLRDEERFGPWVYQVARSAIADHHRAAERHPLPDAARSRGASPDGLEAVSGEPPEAEFSAGQHATPSGDEAEDDDAARGLAAHVAPFVAMLPSPYREALTLTELEGLTQKKAAAMLGLSLSGMKSRVQRGRRQLRRALEDCCNIALDARGHVVSYEPRGEGRAPKDCCD